MTTNQTIDGVSRTFLAGCATWFERLGDVISVERAKELRALLDADISASVATQPQGEPVAWIVTDMNGDNYFAYDRQTPNDKPLYAEQTAPVAVVLPERSNQDYAIEHAEYMALSADDVLAKFQAYGLALLAVDEGGDDGEGELLENIDSARSNLQESLVELRSMVYEFRKRSAKSR